MNRSLSLRSSKTQKSNQTADITPAKHRFSFNSIKGTIQPELSKKLYRLIKSENYVISSHQNSGRERISIASQLSDWGLATGDDGISDLSDKLGVLLSEIGELEIVYSQNLEDYRAALKMIRNSEASVQPSRDRKTKITDEIQKLKYKEPTSTKLVQLEQELVRAEAENLVAEAQLSNITRQKMKEAYASNLAAIIERSEKQAIIAKHARRMLNLLDDTPVVPGDTRPAYDQEHTAREILAEAEDELRHWRLDAEEVTSNAHLEPNLMPSFPPEGMQEQQQHGSRRVVSSGSTTSSEYIPASGEAPGHQQQTTLHGRDGAQIPSEEEKNATVPQAVPAS